MVWGISTMTTQQIIEVLPFILSGAATTLGLTLFAITIGCIGGMLLGMLTCKQINKRIITPLVNFFLIIINGTPISLHLLLAYFFFSTAFDIGAPAFTACLIALGLNAIARFTELLRHEINQIPQGQWETCYLLGYSLKTTLFSIIFPQVMRNFFPTLIGETISILKETYIVSIIGIIELTKAGMGLGTKTQDPLTAYVLTGLVYLAMTLAITKLARRIEHKFSSENTNSK